MTLTLSPAVVRAHVAAAGRTLTPTWPLSSFIAVNPVSGYEHLPFGNHPAHLAGVRFTRTEAEYHDAHRSGEVSTAALRQAINETVPEIAVIPAVTIAGRAASGTDIALVDLLTPRAGRPVPAGRPVVAEKTSLNLAEELAARWLSILLGSPVWAVRTRDDTLYEAFRRAAPHDRTLPAAVRLRLSSLPVTPEATILAVANSAGVVAENLESTLALLLTTALPGWSSHIAWQSSRGPKATLTDFAAVLLALHHAVDQPLPAAPVAAEETPLDLSVDAERIAAACFGAGSSAAGRASVMRVLVFLGASLRLLIWQAAAEIQYRSGLFEALTTGAPRSDTPRAQLVFCIDTRSEGIRRHLEADPHTHTLGFAGFFATALHYRPLNAADYREYYPALLSAGIPTTDTTTDTVGASVGVSAEASSAYARRLQGLFTENAGAKSTKSAANAPVASFAWAESAGWITGIAAASRTIAPTLTHRIAARLRSAFTPTVRTRIDICERIGVEEQTNLAEATMRMMGLTELAPLVVFTGHRSTTRNNLYQAALDCGACGGNSGAPNARAAAAIFNNPPVRAALAGRGLPIPDDTWFMAAEHDTATDAVVLLDGHLIPRTHVAAVADLKEQFTRAGDALTGERAQILPGAALRPRLGRVRGRAHDWAEMFPELGLARNAALIVGPRRISRGSDLERRVFLHSYEASSDPDGSGLEAIMTAPLIVSQWINHQYYFSTVDPQRFSAGNKTLHNPVHDLGVLSGQAGDLQVGLPWQSVAAGDRLLHTPLRLSVLIQAPLERIGRIISANDSLRDLLDNEWITLNARPDDASPWRRYSRYGFTVSERNPR